MADDGPLMIYFHRGLYLATMLVLLAGLLIPVNGGAGGLPGPDLTMALTIAWAMRRPDHLPVISVAAAMLLADLLLLRPPGLMAALTVLAVEFIRNREVEWRGLPFLMEWLIAASIVFAVFVLGALAHAFLVISQPPLGQTLLRMILTAFVLPAFLLLMVYVFRVGRKVPGTRETARGRG